MAFIAISLQIFYQKFLEMFVVWSSTKHTLFVQTSQFDWLSWQATKRLNLQKILKNQLLRSYIRDKAETLQSCS